MWKVKEDKVFIDSNYFPTTDLKLKNQSEAGIGIYSFLKMRKMFKIVLL